MTYELQPYEGSSDGAELRTRSAFVGIDPLLMRLTAAPVPLTGPEDALVRRAAHRYWVALADVRRELQTPDPDPHLIVAFARAALRELPVTEALEGQESSTRMCQWMTRDRFADLARILDAACAGADVLAVARARVSLAYAGMSLRTPKVTAFRERGDLALDS